MVTIEQIRLNLEISNIKKVSEATGIHINSLYRIKNGETKDPSFKTISKLAELYSLRGVRSDQS